MVTRAAVASKFYALSRSRSLVLVPLQFSNQWEWLQEVQRPITNNMRDCTMHEFLRRVSIIITVFWDMTPYILVRRNPCIDLCVFTSEETLIFKGKGGGSS